MNVRFDSVDSKLDTLDVQLNSGLKQTGEQFAKVDSAIEQLNVTISKEVGYLNHKVTEVDKELYFRTLKQ